MTHQAPLTAGELSQFTGSETFYRHAINRKCVYTEGVQYMAEKAGAYWLLDEILLIQPYEAALKAEDFQVWTLSVDADESAQLCTDGNDRQLYAKRIPWTDFPLPRIELWFANNTLYLPSEH
jgi:hypothetical protein